MTPYWVKVQISNRKPLYVKECPITLLSESRKDRQPSPKGVKEWSTQKVFTVESYIGE